MPKASVKSSSSKATGTRGAKGGRASGGGGGKKSSRDVPAAGSVR